MNVVMISILILKSLMLQYQIFIKMLKITNFLILKEESSHYLIKNPIIVKSFIDKMLLNQGI
jgi:hypothetical protein